MNCIILTYLNIPTFVRDNSDRILVLNTSVAAVSAVVFAVIKRILIDCPKSPHPIQSVGTGQHCSAGDSVGSSPKWLPQRVRWPNETNHDRCPSSSKDHH